MTRAQGFANRTNDMSAPQMGPAVVPNVDPDQPEKHRDFEPPGSVLRRTIGRSRSLPPPLPREPEPQDAPWWFEWYERGIELNRARSLAAIGNERR
jgi:hypothetical protein